MVSGYHPYLEEAFGTIVGFTDGTDTPDPIIQIHPAIYDKLSFTTFVVPKDCVFSKKRENEVPVMLDTESRLDTALYFADTPNEWRARFCRELYRNLIKAMQQRISVLPPEKVSVNPTGHRHYSHRLHDDPARDIYSFKFTVTWREKHGLCTDFRFKIKHKSPHSFGDDTVSWFNDDRWVGSACVSVSHTDAHTSLQYRGVYSYGYKSKQTMPKDLDMTRVVDTWLAMRKKILDSDLGLSFDW